jgi:hypothetical protein
VPKRNVRPSRVPSRSGQTDKAPRVRLSESELQDEIAAAFAELGIDDFDPRIVEERVLEAYREVMRKANRAVSIVEVANDLGLKSSTVRMAALRLVERGSMLVVRRSATQSYYVPRAKKSA